MEYLKDLEQYLASLGKIDAAEQLRLEYTNFYAYLDGCYLGHKVYELDTIRALLRTTRECRTSRDTILRSRTTDKTQGSEGKVGRRNVRLEGLETYLMAIVVTTWSQMFHPVTVFAYDISRHLHYSDGLR